MTNERIVIVGGGAAGLTAAAYCAREGHSVLVLEKNERTGGLLGTFTHEGFAFDTGPRAFVNSGIVKPILKDLGINWETVGNTISIGVEDQLFPVRSIADLDAYQRMLQHLYPENAADIDAIIRSIARLSAYTRVLYEFDNPNFGSFKGDFAFIFRKLIPWTFKFLHALYQFNRYSMPMEAYLHSLTKNQSLTDIILQHFFRETPTYFALGYFHVYMDYFYPQGGTGTLARVLESKALESGAVVRTGSAIVEVIPAEKRVVDSEGQSYPYDRLVWAADLKAMYRMVNPSGLAPDITAALHEQKEQTETAAGAESVFILYLSVNRPPDWFRQRGGEHMFFTPSRQGLGETNRSELRSLLDAFESTPRNEIEGWLDRFCRLNTFEVSLPALRDPAMAPAGQTGVMISFLFEYELAEKVQQAGWYEEFKQLLENKVIDIFSETVYPGIGEDILHRFSSTPLTIEKTTGSSGGAITGWSFETDPPVVNVLKDIPKSVLTPLPDVYQAGQWAYSPAGVPIAMLTGWYASQEIKKGS